MHLEPSERQWKMCALLPKTPLKILILTFLCFSFSLYKIGLMMLFKVLLDLWMKSEKCYLPFLPSSKMLVKGQGRGRSLFHPHFRL